MKKKIFALFMSLITCFTLASCKGKKHDISEYVLKMDWKEDFKIMQLTDLHMSNKDDRDRQYRFLDKTYSDAKADGTDLVVVTGDLFTFADKRTAKELFSYFDSKQIPWTVTFGNHDEQCYFSIEWLTRYLNKLNDSKESYCIFKDIQDDDITGNANFAINLMDGETIKKQIILIDSNRYHFGLKDEAYMYYDYIQEDQINWYKDLVDYTTNLNGGTVVESMMFYHIEIPEYNYIFDFDEENKTGVLKDNVELVFGEIKEKVCCPEYNSGLYDVIKEKGSTIAMFAGHDHTNDFVAKYDGIYFCYGVTSTDRIYYEEGKIGALICKIKNSGLEFSQVRHDYED